MGFQTGLVEGGVVNRTVGNKGGLILSRRTERRAFVKEGIALVRAFSRKWGCPPSQWSEAQHAEARPKFDRLEAKWGCEVEWY